MPDPGSASNFVRMTVTLPVPAVHDRRQGGRQKVSGNFVISLDFELMWGMRDIATCNSYGRNVLGVRRAIPALLEMFDRRTIRATWAVVGLLLCETKDELLARLPSHRPSYSNPALSPYTYLDEVGSDERSDPYYFGASLARQIAACPGQEIGTHTFSHYYCLENGQTLDQFKADLRCAIDQLGEWDITCRSIVFPRNQYSEDHLSACRDLGITHFRGNELTWFARPVRYAEETKIRRMCRLIDAYVNIAGQHVPRTTTNSSNLTNVASSRFLRPYNRQLAPLDGLRMRRITRALRTAAVTGGTFHLWWHPHNFGVNLDANMAFLTNVIDCYERLAGELGMQNKTMSDVDGKAMSGRRSPCRRSGE
jgi:peptidoglycan/xylan/chitin deacetylase (PgdA/CDA1 family)